MRCHAEVGSPVHLPGADLDLDWLPARPDYLRVQRLVHVRPRLRDVVREEAGDRKPELVHDAEHVIALGHGRHDDPDRHQVEDLVVADLLLLDLVPDAVEVLRAALDLGADSFRVEPFAQLGDGQLDLFLALAARPNHLLNELAVLLRLDVLEGQVLELPLEVPDAEAVRKGREYLQRFLGDAALALRRELVQCLHVVQAVRQLDDHHPHVARHGEEDLADVGAAADLLLEAARAFGLRFPGVFLRQRLLAELGLRQLRDAIHESPDLVTELGGDLRQANGGIFHHVVEQAGGKRGHVHLQLGQDQRHLQGVLDVGGPGIAALAGVRGIGAFVGAPQQIRICGGIITTDFIDQRLDRQRGRLRDQDHDGRWALNVERSAIRRRIGKGAQSPVDSCGTVPFILTGQAGEVNARRRTSGT